MATQKRAVNEKEQFVLPSFPDNASPGLKDLVSEYLAGFKTPQNEQTDWWDASATAIHAFVPLSLADLATKMIIAMHYRDPEIDGGQLAIAAPGLVADRLAIEIELGNIDWAVSQAIARPADGAWDGAEQRLARACADLDALPMPYTDDEVDRLADLRSAAIDAVLELPATTAAQAVRKLELAMFDEEMVRSGVDFPALLAEAKRVTGPPFSPIADPHVAAWALFRSAFSHDPSIARPADDQRFNDTLDEADEVLANEVTTTFAGAAAKLRRAFVAFVQDPWAERLAIGDDIPEHRRRLELEDVYTRIFWSAIEDVERLAAQRGA